MAEPEHTSMHNFAYHPSVASWVQSTALAQLDGASDEQAGQPAPDDFYKPVSAPTSAPTDFEPPQPLAPAAEMTTSVRQRHQTPNGATRSTPRLSVRSVSESVASTSSTPRSTPQIPANRPTVKSLAQKFNQPSSADSSPLSARARPVRQVPATTKESPSYGAYKFNNLKTRDRSQPAASPPPSTPRRSATNGARSSLGQQPASTPSPSRKKITSPTREPGKKPFFGEVVGNHDSSTPGFGIPTMEDAQRETSFLASPSTQSSTIKLVTEDVHTPPKVCQDETLSFHHSNSQPHEAEPMAPQSMTQESGTPRKSATPSRIPVATRRLSASSNSSSSTRSSRVNGVRSMAKHNSNMSPTGIARVPVGRTSIASRSSSRSAQQTLPAVSYRGYRERGKSPQAAPSGPSVSAVITAPSPLTSPRLRNSRERQLVQESPGSGAPTSTGAETVTAQDYFGHALPTATQTPPMTTTELTHSKPSVKLVDTAQEDELAPIDLTLQIVSPLAHGQDEDAGAITGTAPPTLPNLSLSTDGLHIPPLGQSLSAATSFEYDESPILGMPGSFLATPPLAQPTPPTTTAQLENQQEKNTSTAAPGDELLQAKVFQPRSAQQQTLEAPSTENDMLDRSEIGVRESIPIMLGMDGISDSWDPIPEHTKVSPQLSSTNQDTWISFTESESPTDPFGRRDTLKPEDSASNVGYKQKLHERPRKPSENHNAVDPMSVQADSEAYDVINKVLTTYHNSDVITPEIAQLSWTEVQRVQPVVANYEDWESKEATETYLARVLSDAAARSKEVRPTTRRLHDHASPKKSQKIRPMSIRALEADPDEPATGGTAIIFPTESQRYSRGSRKSNGSSATTIWEGPSRPDSSSGGNSGHGNAVSHNPVFQRELFYGPSTQKKKEDETRSITISKSSEGLGLSASASQRQSSRQSSPSRDPQQHAPPRPPYSPPPPPVMETMLDHLVGSSLQQFVQEGPISRPPIPLTHPHLADSQAEGTGTPSSETTSTPVAEPESGASPVEQPQFDSATQLVRKRYRVIEELTKTEHSFCVDMMVAHQIFEGTSKDVLSDSDRRLLFSNCRDLEAFSHDLWKKLKDAIRPVVNQTPPSENSSEPYDEFVCCTPENDRLVRIGEIMLQATTKMERVYTTYYLNYGDASDFIKKNQDNPELLGWVMACFQHCPNLTTAWDLDSLLVKPCQRMLKYPILLDDLIAKTDPNHPDLEQLRKANEQIKSIALRIEQAKSRQHTLRAATSEGKKQKKKGRFGNNIVKALISNKDRAKNMQEAALVFEDQEYNQITQKFGGHFFQIQIVIRDFDQYLDAITDQMLQLNNMMLGFITVSETGPSANAEMESTWRRWAMAHVELQNKALETHKVNVRERAMKPICEVWDQWVQPQKLMEQRKKLLLNYAKYKQAMDRKEKVDPKLEEAAKDFMTINDSLKLELPRLYELTKSVIRLTEIIFMGIQKDWYKTCSKKILPLLESEPQHTTSMTYDFKVYADRFKSDYRQMEDRAKSFAIVNHDLLNLASFTSPVTTFYSDDGSSRKSSSRRTESIGSEYSSLEHQRNRNSGGYASMRSNVRSYDGQPPRSSPATPLAPGSALPSPTTPGATNPYTRAAERAISPSYSQASESTVTTRGRSSGSRTKPMWGIEGAMDDYDDPSYAQPPSAGPSFLNPTLPTTNSSTLVSSIPGSTRTSGVFNSALPMSEAAPAELSANPGDPDGEVEVLFLAASLFEFNIAHDRREGGIPYLVYVPGEIFDVIGMKGELWLARNQDDPLKTVGWIWEKHFARILPDEA